MKIKQAQLIASEDLRKNYNSKQVIELLTKFAIRNLKLSEMKAIKFAERFEKSDKSKTNDKKTANQFFTWHYLNYIIGYKNGRIKTEIAINAAFFHFIEHQKETGRLVFETFCKDELELQDTKIIEHTVEALDSDQLKSTERIKLAERFYIWYYINYAAEQYKPKQS